MCGNPQQPESVEGVLAMLDAALTALNSADAGSWTTAEQARALRGLERVEAMQTAARARVLAVFAAQGGHEDDGLGSAGAWLRWHTGVTAGAAAGAVGWVRRLAAHPVVGEALAAGRVSASWARQLCAWSDQLPEALRPDADRILVGAATGGAALRDLAGLAREMYERSHTDDGGPGGDDDGFASRYLRLGITFRGAGRTEGDLTPGCAAALAAVLEALGKKAGPEDTRTAAQRRHDALEEACRRLIASGMLPGRAAQPTHVNVHMTLSQLRGEPGAPDVEAAWAGARASEPGWLSGPDAQAAACDATLIPTVTGHPCDATLDATLDHLTGIVLGEVTRNPGAESSLRAGSQPGPRTNDSAAAQEATSQAGAGCGPARQVLSPQARAALRHDLLRAAAMVLSGPGGLASRLRSHLGAAAAAPIKSVSLPLDVAAPTETIPAHLRRAALLRHPRCAFPGCAQHATTCEVHHIIPRSEGGPTTLPNLIPLCRFHHLTVIHRWGWTITLHPDTTTTASSPDGHIIHSHSPPTLAA